MSDEEFCGVLDPDRGANEALVVDGNVGLASEEGANLIQVVQNSGAAEVRQLPKNIVKAKLIRETEEQLKRNDEEEAVLI